MIACALTLVFLVLHPFAWQMALHMADRGTLSLRGINIAFTIFWSIERGIFAGLMLLAVYSGRTRS